MTIHTLEPDTTTTTVLDVNLDAVPMCERGDDCAGDHGPAVARLIGMHRCDHREVMLVCQQCLAMAVAYQWRIVIVQCGQCQDTHSCLMACHITPAAL